MTGFERLKNMLAEWTEKHGEDEAFNQTVNYLLNRPDLEQKFLNEEKSLDGLHDFIHNKGQKHRLNGWCYITNEVVFAWAVMYFSLPNALLNITSPKKKQDNKVEKANSKATNVISIEQAKKKIEEKKNDQISLFGGATV